VVFRSSRLAVVLGLNLVLVAALLVVGVVSHSLGVFAEGVDYLADAAAIGVSLLALHLSRRPPTIRRPGVTRGLVRSRRWSTPGGYSG